MNSAEFIVYSSGLALTVSAGGRGRVEDYVVTSWGRLVDLTVLVLAELLIKLMCLLFLTEIAVHRAQIVAHPV